VELAGKESSDVHVDADALRLRENGRSIRDWQTVIVGASVSLVAFILYWMTAARDVMTNDTPDYLIAAKTLGVAHPPGYPLLDVLSYLFSWLPVGSTPFRIGLLAVISSTATVALVYATVWRLVGLRIPAAAAGFALACTPLFWRWSLQAEIFPFNNFLIALTVYLMVRWHQDPPKWKYLVGAALAFGLALSGQETGVLLIPAIAWMLWIHRSELKQQRKVVGYAVLAFVGGFLPYIYIPFAAAGHSPINSDYVRSLPSFLRLVLREDYGGPFDQGLTGVTGSNFVVRTVYLFRGIGLVVGIFSLGGIFYAFRRIRWYFWFVLIAFACTGVGYALATNLDPTVQLGHFQLERFFLLPLVIVAPLVGLGVTFLGEALSEIWPSFGRGRNLAVAASGVAIASLVIVGVNYSTINVSNDHVAGNYTRAALDELPPHSILFDYGDESQLIAVYDTEAAKIRPDVTVVIPELLSQPWYADVLRHNHQINVPRNINTLNFIRDNPHRTVAFIGPPPDTSIDGKYYLYPDGLVSFLERARHPILVTRDESDNEAQLAKLDIPNYKSIKVDSYEPAILAHYANIPYRIGQAYALAGQKSEAIKWYRKALAIDPSISSPSKAIKQLDGKP